MNSITHETSLKTHYTSTHLRSTVLVAQLMLLVMLLVMPHHIAPVQLVSNHKAKTASGKAVLPVVVPFGLSSPLLLVGPML